MGGGDRRECGRDGRRHVLYVRQHVGPDRHQRPRHQTDVALPLVHHLHERSRFTSEGGLLREISRLRHQQKHRLHRRRVGALVQNETPAGNGVVASRANFRRERVHQRGVRTEVVHVQRGRDEDARRPRDPADAAAPAVAVPDRITGPGAAHATLPQQGEFAGAVQCGIVSKHPVGCRQVVPRARPGKLRRAGPRLRRATHRRRRGWRFRRRVWCGTKTLVATALGPADDRRGEA